MTSTSLPRALAAGTAACALAIAAASPAVAAPSTAGADGCACGGARVAEPPSRLFTAGTDVAAPDQQNPIDAPAGPVPQAAPTSPRQPQVLTPAQAEAVAANADFQWDDAALGAGGTLAILLVATGGVLVLRVRRGIGRPLPA